MMNIININYHSKYIWYYDNKISILKNYINDIQDKYNFYHLNQNYI